MNRRRIVYPLLVAGLALGVGWLEGRWHSDRTEAAKSRPARPTRPVPPPTGVEVPMTIGPAPRPTPTPSEGADPATPPGAPRPPLPPTVAPEAPDARDAGR